MPPAVGARAGFVEPGFVQLTHDDRDDLVDAWRGVLSDDHDGVRRGDAEEERRLRRREPHAGQQPAVTLGPLGAQWRRDRPLTVV